MLLVFVNNCMLIKIKYSRMIIWRLSQSAIHHLTQHSLINSSRKLRNSWVTRSSQGTLRKEVEFSGSTEHWQ